MKVYAVIDTNVIISSMLTHNIASPTKMVLSYVRVGIGEWTGRHVHGRD